MRVAVIASHAWPLPSPARGGDSQILLDLTRTLAEMRHDVTLFAPKGTRAPEGVELCEMSCSYGQASPSAEECEREVIDVLDDILRTERVRHHFDVVHDCSVTKRVAGWCHEVGIPAISTVWGGPWRYGPGRNVVAQSKAQLERLLRGATDFENSPTPDMGGANGTPLADCRYVWNGIDCDAYRPTGKPKQDWFLLFGRWHPVRGIEQGIELAKATGINLLLAGTDPEEDHPYQADYARRICEMVRGCDNISVEFLPMDNEEHHERKVELFSDARALLFLPQFQEPFGLPQVEAMACGTAVIANGMGSTNEVTGVTDTVGNGIRAFSEQYDEDWGRSQSSAFRARACHEFSRERMAENYLGLYHDVVNGKGWG